jgi:predicted transglutaminase-like cysteine proteinase
MTVDQIFQDALARFEYRSDMAQFGRPEYWMTRQEIDSQFAATGRLIGDCDDFAALVLSRLRDAGHQARYVFCLTRDGYHLVVESDGLIFDSLQKQVLPIHRLPYKWVSVSGYQPNQIWRKVITTDK